MALADICALHALIECGALMTALEVFQQKLGHRFKDSQLLDRALRHASLDVDDDNEKLEFLGDRVLGLVIADRLVADYSDEAEGALARRLSQLVSRRSCAAVAEDMALADVLRTDEGIRNTEHMSHNMLADACEAVLGAIYLDGGLEAARAVIEAHWQSLFVGQVDAPIDSKSALQEWLMQRGLPVPDYEIIDRTGPDHAPEFNVGVTCAQGSAQGSGRSRKIAEQRAASALLNLLQEGEGG